MKDYFNLQFVMTNRKIKEAGFHPLLAYLLGLASFVLLSQFFFYKTEFAKYLMMLVCIGLQFKLSKLDRTDFLLSTFGNSIKKKIRISENLLVCIPFLSMLVYKNNFIEASILFVMSIILATFSFQQTNNFTIPTPFSKRLFEFSVGFRKSFFIFPIAYALIVIAIYVDNLNLGIFSILLIFLTSLSYYTKPEPEYYVWIHSESPRAFLKNKVLSATKNTTLILIPILMSLLICFPIRFEILLLTFLMGMLFLWTIILAKYAAYPRSINLPEGILIAFCLYFPILLLAIIPFFYYKSINKLKLILND